MQRLSILLIVIATLTLPLQAGFAASPPDPLAGYPEGSYIMDNGAIAVPLRANTPDWFTEEVRAKTIAAGQKGMLYDVEADMEIPLATQHLFIRPGSWMISPAWCTMNFIYGVAGAYQIGTAGHCANVGDNVVIQTLYPTPVLAFIGKVAQSVNGGVGNDYAFVDIFPIYQPHVDANVAGIWGPQGGKFAAGGLRGLKHFGHGTGVGTGGTPRVGAALAWSPTTVSFDSAAAPGDSGSPILLAGDTTFPLGQGVGVLTHLVIFGPTFTVIAGTRLTVFPEVLKDGDILITPPA